MNQSKSHAEGGAASVKPTLTDKTQGMIAGLDQATKNCTGALLFGRETGEAMMRSAASVNKATEALRCELQAYSQQAANDTIAATKAIMGSKSVFDVFELQSEFAKTAFENYAKELTKLGELFTTAAKEGFLPFRSPRQ